MRAAVNRTLRGLPPAALENWAIRSGRPKRIALQMRGAPPRFHDRVAIGLRSDSQARPPGGNKNPARLARGVRLPIRQVGELLHPGADRGLLVVVPDGLADLVQVVVLV